MAQLDETAYQQLLQALAAHHTGGDQGSCDGELQLTLQGIFDARNRSLIPGPSSFAPYDPRQFAVGPDRQTRFYFKVENQTARVALQITAGPENETARAFYRDQPLVLFLEEAVAPGEHWFSWDGTISELRTLIWGCPGRQWGGACKVADPGCLSKTCHAAASCGHCKEKAGPDGGCYWEPGLWQGSCTDAWFYWSSSGFDKFVDHYWVVRFQGGGQFDDGVVGFNEELGQGSVRCTRRP